MKVIISTYYLKKIIICISVFVCVCVCVCVYAHGSHQCLGCTDFNVCVRLIKQEL